MQISDLIQILLKNRGLTEPAEIADFFSPPDPLTIPVTRLGWTQDQVAAAVTLVNQHLSAGNPIAVYGDYDVDGITSAAIIWETLYLFSDKCFPYIPHRRREGYGLTQTGIDNCLRDGAKLIIVADSGITAIKEIEYCRQSGCDIIIIDHHQPPNQLPNPNVLLFSTATSAAGLSWFFSRELLAFRGQPLVTASETLSLCAISVICDLVPLLGINRSLAKFGLTALNATTRPGLAALFVKAGIIPGQIGSYEVGFIIGPRINAMGRLEHGLDSLRLLCTRNSSRAMTLAHTLNETNQLRQDLTFSSVQKAVGQFAGGIPPSVILISDKTFDEGVIGLIAAKMVEEFYRPSLVISVGEEICKGSGRSVTGFHLTDFLRSHSRLLSSVGGHEMAAGFSLALSDLAEFTQEIANAATQIDSNQFVRHRHVDAEIPLDLVGQDLFDQIEKFAPFGLANPRPVFSSEGVEIFDRRWIGKTKSHLKFMTGKFEAIYFNAPADQQLSDTPVKLVYSVNQNEYNGLTRLQLIVKEIHGFTS